MITKIEKDCTKQYKSLNEELKKEILTIAKLEKPDYSLERFNRITKEIYYKNILKTNIGLINKHINLMLEKTDYTKEDVLNAASFARTLQDFIEKTPEFKDIKKEEEKKELEKLEQLKETVKKKVVKKSKESKNLIEKMKEYAGEDNIKLLIDYFEGTELDY
jgi:23S rRNA G2445 N2-methylase RlmL